MPEKLRACEKQGMYRLRFRRSKAPNGARGIVPAGPSRIPAAGAR